MNLKHGFYSTNPLINPDILRLGCPIPDLDDMVFVGNFLHGEPCRDPIRAHKIAKAIFVAGKCKYPTLWEKADQYVKSYEYASLERFSSLPVAESVSGRIMIISATAIAGHLTLPQCVSDFAGTYVVDFMAAELNGISDQKLASIALNLFHESVPLRMRDSFEFTVSTGEGLLVERDSDDGDYFPKLEVRINKIAA